MPLLYVCVFVYDNGSKYRSATLDIKIRLYEEGVYVHCAVLVRCVTPSAFFSTVWRATLHCSDLMCLHRKNEETFFILHKSLPLYVATTL